MKKKGFHHSNAFAVLCGTILFVAVAVPLVIRAHGLRHTWPVEAGSQAPGGSLMTAFLPGARVMRNWEQSGAIGNYGPNKLFEIINGGADAFLRLGFRELLRAQYQDREKGEEVDLTVEMYDMAAPENAFGIFRAERGDSPSEGSVGDEVTFSVESVFFRKGNLYVKLVTSDFSGDQAERMRRIAADIAQRIPAGGEVAALAHFPGEGLVAASERYDLKNSMGLSAMTEVYLADYASGEDKYTLFFSSTAGAEGVLKEVQNELGWKPETAPAGGVCLVDADTKQAFLLMRRGRALAGARGKFDQARLAGILGDLLAKLEGGSDGK